MCTFEFEDETAGVLNYEDTIKHQKEQFKES